tara:strand:- start:366 stop:947 length:582 start_codon:yes stop_codon:yes gene_type:complete
MATRNAPQPRPGTPIENRNFLSPVGFKFGLKRAPAAAFFCNEANIPNMTLGIAEQPSYLRNIPVPGDKIQFGDLSIRFLVDEDLSNYMEIQNWIRGLGYPETLKEFDDLEKQDYLYGAKPFDQRGDQIYSDGTLQILSSNLVPKFNVKFRDLFPYSLSTMSFDATDTDIEYFTADATFKYTLYTLTDLEDNPL